MGAAIILGLYGLGAIPAFGIALSHYTKLDFVRDNRLEAFLSALAWPIFLPSVYSGACGPARGLEFRWSTKVPGRVLLTRQVARERYLEIERWCLEKRIEVLHVFVPLEQGWLFGFDSEADAVEFKLCFG